MRKLAVDNFAGGGGASTGIRAALGRDVDIAINHDPEAIAMHRANHPGAFHYCEDVWNVDPIQACQGRPVGLAWFSPDCKHFSKAKGGKPVEKKIRGLAWVAVRWAKKVHPDVIMLENVEEFVTWGPVGEDNQPVKEMAGTTFEHFVKQLKKLGYKVEWRELKACDYGAPTIRKRFFLIARCDGLPIDWPKPTHGDPEGLEVRTGLLKPWRTAAEIIDWSLPCPSIFDSRKEIWEKYGLHAQRPLSEKTMQRIARGIVKFVLENPAPFIVAMDGWDREGRHLPVDKPLNTILSKAKQCVVTPEVMRVDHTDSFIVAIGQNGFAGDGRQYPIDMPLTTVVSKAEHCLITPAIIKVNHTTNQGTYKCARGQKVEEQLQTITAKHGYAVATPILTKFQQNSIGQEITEPVDTVMPGAARFGVVAPILSQYHGQKTPDEVRGQQVDEPIMTLDTSNRYAVACAHMQMHYDGGYTGAGSSMEDPLGTVTTKDHNSLCTVHLIKMKGDADGQTVKEPLHTITAQGKHYGEVRAFLVKYYGTGEGSQITEPMHTVTAKDRMGLVMIHGQPYAIVDIGLRMLTPRELFRAQGFPEDYVIEVDADGKPYPKDAQVARCGNSVCPQLAEALVRANVPDMCEGRVEVAG
jgi:DNA (cytosine-5)-methyltransferase 1